MQPSTKCSRKQVEDIPDDLVENDMALPMAKCHQKKLPVSKAFSPGLSFLRLPKQKNMLPSRPEPSLQGALQPILKHVTGNSPFGFQVPNIRGPPPTMAGPSSALDAPVAPSGLPYLPPRSSLVMMAGPFLALDTPAAPPGLPYLPPGSSLAKLHLLLPTVGCTTPEMLI